MSDTDEKRIHEPKTGLNKIHRLNIQTNSTEKV